MSLGRYFLFFYYLLIFCFLYTFVCCGLFISSSLISQPGYISVYGPICLCLPPDRTWYKVNDPKVDYSGDFGKEKSSTSRSSSPAGLCWSSAYLVQCRLDEPSWTWTQIWVQARMPDYSLNWTARSNAIHGGQRCQSCSSHTQKWPSQSRRPYGLKSAFVGQRSLGSKPTANNVPQLFQLSRKI